MAVGNFFLYLGLALSASGAWARSQLELGRALFNDPSFSRPKSSVSCASCHSNSTLQTTTLKHRNFSDAETQSPIPNRFPQIESKTSRNSQPLMGIWTERDGPKLFHFDGEFAALEDLVQASFTGRNFGWLATEHAEARSHFERVAYGLYGIDGSTAAHAVSQYLRSLDFARDAERKYAASPFDAFLKANDLPRADIDRDTPARYTRVLRSAIERLHRSQIPRFIRRFSAREWEGMRLFFGKARCAECHFAPNFTDFGFHNTGVSQRSYDALHGEGQFMSLKLPTLTERAANPETFLPPNEIYTRGTGRFSSMPQAHAPYLADLGVWNMAANASRPKVQYGIRWFVCQTKPCSNAELLERSVARFKTPGLRGLGGSNPYFHDGSASTIESAIEHYIHAGRLARSGLLRNADPLLQTMDIVREDLAPISAFLHALD